MSKTVHRKAAVIAGRYSFDREIGRGGMGAVWLGRDEMLGRQVALKQIGLLPGADGTDLARAEREARLAAQLNHPHVVAVFDLVVDEDSGHHWLVMEYVDGKTITQLVRKHGRIPVDDAALVMEQVADALAAAHAAGIVHRDVKPSNVLVDRRGFAKLADFGIARITNDPSLTQTGMVTGSPAYLAPEVAAGKRADEASDVWSLGATLFHMLAGRPPYDIGDQVLGGLYRIVNEEPPRLPDAGRLAPLLEATMVKDPKKRWSMAQVHDFLSGSPAPTRDDETRVLAPTPPAPPTTRPKTQPTTQPTSVTTSPPHKTSGRSNKGLVAVLVGVLALVLVLGTLLATRGNDDNTPTAASPSASTSKSSSPSAKNSPTKKSEPSPTPTAQGMDSFIRSYVATVSTNPDEAWPMLTPKFQRESGGRAKYRKFWGDVGTGHVRDITADPHTLVVSYRVKFDNFGSGKRPTVLKLVYRDGRYFIDGESTQDGA
jgi:eukaryotic-like serine/threonine-protein kinase